MTRPYRYRAVQFFALAYALSWSAWLAAIYAGSRPELEPYAALANLVGVLGPIGATLFLVLTSGSAALKRDFRDRLLDLRRIRPPYAALAVLMPFAVIGLSILLSVWLGQPADQLRLAGGAGLIPLVVLALMLAPICEEVGWHGYGADSLRDRFGMLAATLLFAVLWCAWHVPLVLVPGTYQHELAAMGSKIFVVNFFASIVPAGIIANWLYYKNGRSIPAAILFHAMLNAAAVLIAAGQVAKVIATLLFTAIAAALILGDRRLFAEGPRDFLKA
ncbi:MAG: lysostaphin resistance A-like protein [Methyloceanibacter sp.]